MRTFAFERRWAEVIARTLLPRGTLGGALDGLDAGALVALELDRSPWHAALLLRLGLWIAWFWPLLTLRAVSSLGGLSEAGRIASMEALLKTRSYTARQAAYYLKLVVSSALIGERAVLARIGAYKLGEVPVSPALAVGAPKLHAHDAAAEPSRPPALRLVQPERPAGASPAPDGFFDASQPDVELDDADVVVVGSGAGGGAAARTLASAGLRVCVLEEGPLVRPEQLSPSLNASLALLFREQGKTTMFGTPPIPYLQGRVVGGTTFVNSAIVWRLPEKVLARWHKEHGLSEGLPLRALEEASAALEAELHVQAVRAENQSGSDALMRKGAGRAGVEARTIHRNEDGCRGSGRCFHGCPSAAKQSTAVNSLRRAAADGARIFANARATRVVLQSGRAVAVEGVRGGDGPRAGQPFRVGARKAIVIAASAVQTPNLLARSGLRSAHLGRHFMAHPGTTVMALYPGPVDMWNGAAQGFEAYGLRDTVGVKFETINVPPEVATSRLPGAGPALAARVAQLGHLASWAVALRADAEGTVRPSRIFGDLVTYSLTASDVQRLRQGVRALAEMHFLAGAREVIPGVYGAPEILRSPDELPLLDRAPAESRSFGMLATHLFGGCRAGKDPAGSVVDGHLRVHGVPNLYAMDASVFPSNTGVNPQHSIMAIATVAARRLAGG